MLATALIFVCVFVVVGFVWLRRKAAMEADEERAYEERRSKLALASLMDEEEFHRNRLWDYVKGDELAEWLRQGRKGVTVVDVRDFDFTKYCDVL